MKLKSIVRKSLAIVLAGTMMFSLTACGGGTDKAAETEETTAEATKAPSETAAADTSASSESVTLEFQQWWEPELPDGVLRGICDTFTEQTGINIELLSNPYADTKTQVAAGAAAGTMADVVGLDGAWVYDFAKQGSIANLSELMKADGYDDSQLSDQIQVDGGTYMIPVVNFAYPMYANMDLLAAGITELPTTWSEFQADCAAVTNADKNIYGWIIPLSSDSPSGIQNCFMSWLWASGGSMLASGKPGLTGNDNLVKTVDYVKGLFDANLVAPGAYSMTEADEVEEFANGRVAFMTDSLAHLTTIKEAAPDMNIQFMSVPKMDGYTDKSGMDVASWGIGVSSNSEHQTEAMQFVEYLLSPEVNSQLAVAANAFPGNSTADPDYSAADPLFVSAYTIFQGCYAVNEFTGLPTAEDLMRSFDAQLQLYYDGDTASAADMLAASQDEWMKAFQ